MYGYMLLFLAGQSNYLIFTCCKQTDAKKSALEGKLIQEKCVALLLQLKGGALEIVY